MSLACVNPIVTLLLKRAFLYTQRLISLPCTHVYRACAQHHAAPGLHLLANLHKNINSDVTLRRQSRGAMASCRAATSTLASQLVHSSESDLNQAAEHLTNRMHAAAPACYRSVLSQVGIRIPRTESSRRRVATAACAQPFKYFIFSLTNPTRPLKIRSPTPRYLLLLMRIHGRMRPRT